MYVKHACCLLGAALVFGIDVLSVRAQMLDSSEPEPSIAQVEFEPAPSSPNIYAPEEQPQYTPQEEPRYTPQPSLEEEQLGQEDIYLESQRPTPSVPSYIGIGANIGVKGGDTDIGETSFAAFSKIGITSNLSFRPSIFVSDDLPIQLPLTFDFPFVAEGLTFSPYLGAGMTIAAGDDGAVDFLATGGVDVPVSREITATASVSASLFENPAVGILLGLGLNF